ncbi:MAG: hypothetical protein K0R39_328 [Symbiobacteriaceae bacterium]|jgi:predicted component of viral defense system (DUF524 family)|nr:hypothetical protein [Symbiobacteriaceae bacterium]
MGATDKTSLPISGADGLTVGWLHLQVLPSTKRPNTLLDFQKEDNWDRSLEPVQIMEEQEYLYEFAITDASKESLITVEPSWLFERDDKWGKRGRLRPRLHTGAIHAQVFVDGLEVGRFSLEVRSAKLDYLKHYRWMLEDIAEEFAEIVMERFAASEQRFEADTESSAATLYQRFAFVQSLLAGENFDAAIQQVLGRPHRLWTTEEEHRAPGRGVPSGSAVARQMASGGPRVDWPGGRLSHIPSQFIVQRTVETLDTPENRFVKFALSQWLDVSVRVDQVLAGEKETGPALRGRREARAVIEYLSQLLAADIFDEVGPMDYFPAGSQVLQRRAGYREIFRFYVQSEAAATLRWEGAADVYSAGQKNVAALYEFWAYLQLANVVEKLCDQFQRDALVEEQPDGMGIALKRGWQKPLTGTLMRHNRRMQLDLYFNRTFSQGDSWTLPMRPDCSLHIAPCEGDPAPFQEVWVHFDAKYKVDNLLQIFGRVPEGEGGADAFLKNEEETEAKKGTPKHADLLKMHAYKDAIKRSAGAYVLYPGLDNPKEPFVAYHEILPGLGAFPLRPTDAGAAEGADSLAEFLSKVLDHVATQHTQHERSRYWLEEAFEREAPVLAPAPAAPFVKQPPADTPVLLGFVKSEAHRQWIGEQKLYNVRADGRRGTVEERSPELGAQIVLLYSDTWDSVDVWAVRGLESLTVTNMVYLGYPDPGGDLYHGLLLRPVDTAAWPVQLTSAWVKHVREMLKPDAEHGAPVAATWLDLIRHKPS